jgi:hypothetical protein
MADTRANGNRIDSFSDRKSVDPLLRSGHIGLSSGFKRKIKRLGFVTI